MSSPKGKRDVVRLRTFADDVASVRAQTGQTGPVPDDVLPNEAPQQKGVLHTVKKKDLELKDTSSEGTALDADGIKFDEETATQVAEQAHAEKQTVAELDQRQALLDAVSGEPSAPTPTASEAVVAPAPATEKPTSIIPKSAKPAAAPATGASAPATETKTFASFNAAQTGKAPKAGTVVMPPRMQKSAAQPTPPVGMVGLEKSETIDKIDAAPVSTFDDAAQITDNDLAAGEIVSDKKRERFKIVPAISEAVSGWFEDTKEQIEEAQREKHTVAKIATRVDTIKAAAQERTLAPEEDYSEVAERLRQVERVDKPDVPVLVKPKSTAEARWTHTTGQGGTPEVTATTPTPEPVAATPTAPNTIETAAPVQIVHEPKQANMTAQDINAIAAQQLADAPKPSRGFSVPSIDLPSIPNAREYLPSPSLAIVVVVIAILSGVGTSLYFFWQPGDSVTLPAPTTQPLFTAQQQTNINVTSHAETMNTLLSAITSNPSTVYMYFTDPGTGAVISPTDTMSFLAPQAPGAFIRSVTNVSFGGDQSRPFIVLKVNNFDTAFSGMLAWEQTMSADLAPLFGPVVTESFDPLARTTDQTRTAFFRDVVASNLSGRLLADEFAEDRIVYAFIDKQTIIVTTDRLQLANILPLIR